MPRRGFYIFYGCVVAAVAAYTTVAACVSSAPLLGTAEATLRCVILTTLALELAARLLLTPHTDARLALSPLSTEAVLIGVLLAVTLHPYGGEHLALQLVALFLTLASLTATLSARVTISFDNTEIAGPPG